MDVERFFTERKLRRIQKDSEKRNAILKVAAQKSDESKKLFAADFFSQALVTAYTSMFHSARALLYNDDIQEKSHYATYVYLRLVNSFLSHQKERKELLYGFEYQASKVDVRSGISDAEDFLEEVRRILSDGNL